MSAIPRFIGSSAWARLSAQQQLEIGTIALELVVANKTACATENADPVRHRATCAAGSLLVSNLDEAVTRALAGERYGGMVPSMVGDICTRCGCTQFDACPGGCGWHATGLCTACVGGAGRMRARQARALS